MHGNGQNATQSVQRQPQPQGAQPYYAQHEFGGSAELTTTLVHAIARITGADMTETEASLLDHVDPDALNRLFTPKEDGTFRSNSQFSFTMWGYQISVYSDGQIAIVPPQQGAPHHG